jgi:hypothetical protein
MKPEELEKLIDLAALEYVRFPVMSHRKRMEIVVRAILKAIKHES